jgi:SAM-dependent methyltransferase
MDTPTGHDQNADQIAYWNGPGGQRWARRQQEQDILLAPAADVLIDRAGPKAGERIIDVGCGSGVTTIAFARKVGPSGHVLGVDVSGPMLERARQSAPKDLPVEFALADATIYPFVPASIDLLASRFGVMFFADPAKSFANMRKALRPSGRLAFACWREPRENPVFMTPLQAAINTSRSCRSRDRKILGRLHSPRRHACTAFWARRVSPASRWSHARSRSIVRTAVVLTERCKARSTSDR